jgi:nucleoside-triphosphatase THEP1
MIEHAEQRAKEIQNRQNQKIIVVSGPRESGKTTRLLELFKDLNSASVNAGGFVSIRILNDKNTSGYNLYDLQKGDLGFLMHENIDFGNGKVGRFFINEEAFKTGNKLVDKLIDQSSDVVILDEIGKLEAAGQGWAASLQKALTSKASVVMVSINPEHLDNVSKTFKFNPFQIVNPAEWDAKALTALIVKLIAQTKAVRIV